ncbi:MAG: hypothetical protein OXR66_01465 [Candidatus Woesearchaeota archaeon]|nr:hypothetical protein [Candidatus Woesearchaeota archaeon]
MRGQWIIGCFLLLLLCPLAYSASFGIGVEPTKNEIIRNETATYNVTVTNFEQNDAKFQIYTVDPKWQVATEPNNPSILAVEKGSFTLFLRPTASSDLGTQGVSVTFKDINSGGLIRKSIVLNLRSGNTLYGEYTPTVTLDVNMPYELDPREEIPLQLELRNRNALNITNMTILLESPHFSKTASVRLAPLSEKTVDLSGLRIDPLTTPDEAEFSISLYYNGETVNRLEKNYRIKEYTRVQEHITEKSFFFKTTKTVTVTNEGNVDNTAVITIPSGFFKSLFVGSSLDHDRTLSEGERVLLWKIPLSPNETRVFTYSVNYRIIILLLLLAAAGWIAYMMLRSPVIVLKEAVGIAKPDGMSRVKVRIFIKNRSARLVRGIHVLDKVPSLAEVLKTDSPGSMPPSKIAVSEKQGTLLRWQLDVLEPYEERVLTYQARSKLKIIGKMSLPRSKVKFTAEGKERVVYSNNLELVEKFRDR